MRRRASLAALPLLVLVAAPGGTPASAFGIHGSSISGQVVIDPGVPVS